MTLAVAEKQTTRALTRVALGVLATLLGAFIALGSGAPPAYAHAELLDTTPADGAVLEAAPATVELRFNEQVSVVEDANRLFLGDGTQVPLDARTVNTSVIITMPEGLNDGAYTLGYRVVSADGHPVGGALTFQVGEGNAPAPTPGAGIDVGEPLVTSAVVAILQIAQYLGLFLVAGLVFFERFVLGTTLPRARGFGRLLWGGLMSAVAASLLLLPASGARVAGAELVRYLPESGDLVFAPAAVWAPGVSWQLLVAAGIVTVFGAAALLLRARAVMSGGLRVGGSATTESTATGSSATGSVTAYLAVAAATIALTAPLWVGHSHTVQPVWGMLLADFGHMLAGAYWVGGIAGLIVFLRAGRSAAALGVVSRFSRFALVSVLVLGASGLVMGWLIIGSWTTLFTSVYGQLLLVKLGIVAVIIVLAALNRQVFLPRIAKLPEAEARWIRLRRTLRFEALLLVAVVSVTGFLTNTSPNPNPSGGSTAAIENAAHGHGAHDHSGHDHDGNGEGGTAQPVPITAESQGLTVTGSISPAAIGKNTLTFSLEYAGAPVTSDGDAGAVVAVEARLPSEDLGPLTGVPEFDAATDTYRVEITLPVAGEWQLQVRVRVDTYSEPIAVIPVTIR